MVGLGSKIILYYRHDVTILQDIKDVRKELVETIGKRKGGSVK